MNDHQQKLIELLQQRANWPSHHFTFRAAVRADPPITLIKTLVDFGDQGEYYFLCVNGPTWTKYFKGRRVD
jgi:hypothetical protein